MRNHGHCKIDELIAEVTMMAQLYRAIVSADGVVISIKAGLLADATPVLPALLLLLLVMAWRSLSAYIFIERDFLRASSIWQCCAAHHAYRKWHRLAIAAGAQRFLAFCAWRVG